MALEGPGTALVPRVQAEYMLALAAMAHGDDEAAAGHFQLADQRLSSSGVQLSVGSVSDGRSVPVTSQMLQAQVAWHRFRAAGAAHDAPAQREQVDQLLKLEPLSSDIVLEIVPYLRSIGRDDDASRIFDRAYKSTKAALEADPQNPLLCNELAWLCARSGERPAEALELASRTIAAEPDTAAYLDTAAEANFRVGNIKEAIRLESAR